MMEFAGRWIPRALGTELLLLWLLAVAVVGVIVYLAWRKKPAARQSHQATDHGPRMRAKRGRGSRPKK